jgi:hypothetical protein
MVSRLVKSALSRHINNHINNDYITNQQHVLTKIRWSILTIHSHVASRGRASSTEIILNSVLSLCSGSLFAHFKRTYSLHAQPPSISNRELNVNQSAVKVAHSRSTRFTRSTQQLLDIMDRPVGTKRIDQISHKRRSSSLEVKDG